MGLWPVPFFPLFRCRAPTGAPWSRFLKAGLCTLLASSVHWIIRFLFLGYPLPIGGVAWLGEFLFLKGRDVRIGAIVLDTWPTPTFVLTLEVPFCVRRGDSLCVFRAFFLFLTDTFLLLGGGLFRGKTTPLPPPVVVCCCCLRAVGSPFLRFGRVSFFDFLLGPDLAPPFRFFISPCDDCLLAKVLFWSALGFLVFPR